MLVKYLQAPQFTLNYRKSTPHEQGYLCKSYLQDFQVKNLQVSSKKISMNYSIMTIAQRFLRFIEVPHGKETDPSRQLHAQSQQ